MFAVVVDVKAPADVSRAPLDLVTVLDVSDSMHGQKLDLVKRAMCFVVDQLDPTDRLSVVTFSDAASRITRLSRMSRLVVMGGTNIREGLRVGAQVLLGRRDRNAVAAMILLSDGQDMCLPLAIPQINGASDVARNYASLVPPAFTNAGSRPGPIHTFGFGADHDAAAMHAIAEATGGTRRQPASLRRPGRGS
jgi:Mg-chelatase subunit ChlD